MASLTTKPDLETVLARFDAWWECDLLDRPLLSVPIRSERPHPTPIRGSEDPRSVWFDGAAILDRYEAWVERTEFFAESLPIYYPNLGPDLCSTLFGVELEFGPDTSWSTPIASTAKEALGLEWTMDNAYWRFIESQMKASVERSKGRWLTGYTDIHGHADLLAAILGPGELCLECVEDPESVQAACLSLNQAVMEVYRRGFGILEEAGMPATTWTPSPYRGKMDVASCDFAALISLPMFQQLVLPALLDEMDQMDRVIFHLDGPTSLQHLDLLLSLPQIHALQWVYGAGNGPAARWVEIYQRAQKAGKAVQVNCESADDALEVARHIRPEGAWYCVGEVLNLSDAEQLLEKLATL